MVQPHLPDGANAPSHDGTLTPPGEYDLNCAHWRHLPNTTELVLPSAQPSPQPKRQTDPFHSFCTPHGRKSLLFSGRPFLPKLPLPMGDLKPTQMAITIGSAIFAQITSRCRYTSQWATPSPQNYPFPWRIWTPI